MSAVEATPWASLALACTSRIVVILWSIATSAFVPQYDMSQSVMFTHSPSIPPEWRFADNWIQRNLGRLATWDGVYFHTIAKSGYTHEKLHAFFPFYPWLMRRMSDTLLYTLQYNKQLSLDSALILSGVTINVACFVGSAYLLWKLTASLTNNPLTATLATGLFAITPAGVFMSAVYTESIFTFLSFAGIYITVIATKSQSMKAFYIYSCFAVTLFMVAAATRSNGVVLAGFTVYSFLSHWHEIHRRITTNTNIVAYACIWLCHMTLMVLLIICCAVPWLAFQQYGATLHCDVEESLMGSLIKPLFNATQIHNPEREWCDGFRMQLNIYGLRVLDAANVYGYVQKQYWGAGFLSYFRPERLPDYFFAAPVLIMCSISTWQLCTNNAGHGNGLFTALSKLSSAAVAPLFRAKLPQKSVAQHDLLAATLLHWSFLTLFGWAFMYVQVITRFVATSPAMYIWLAANWPKSRFWRAALLVYCVGYTLIGTTLFTAFYPWT